MSYIQGLRRKRMTEEKEDRGRRGLKKRWKRRRLRMTEEEEDGRGLRRKNTQEDQ